MKLSNTQRRSHNLALAKALAAMGIYVFPSKDKTPMCAVWQRADTSFTPEQRAAERLKFEEKHGFPPPHIGSTVDPKVIERLWRAFEDAVPSISCGPSNLYVVDADFALASEGKRAKDGPNKLANYLAENEVPLDGCVVVDTQSGGQHLYFKNPLALDSKAGILRDLDCDVRGVGGQTVAPGAIRADGKTYRMSLGELSDLIDLPAVPEGIVTAVRTARETTEVKDEVVAASIAKLEEADIAPFEDIFDPIMGYDIETLKLKDDEFGELYKNGTGDISRNRFKITRCLMREWPNMPIEHVLSFHSGWVLENGEDAAGAFNDGSSKKGAGEYNFRDVAREHAKGNSEHKVSDGSSFSSIDDEEIGIPPPKVDANGKGKKVDKWWERITQVPFDLDIDKLPPRPDIYGNGILQLGEMTLVSGASGKGKSAYTLSAAVDLACGVDHLGAGVFHKRKVMLYNAEDALLEMLRRVGSYMRLHKFDDDMKRLVHENLSLLSGKDGRIKLAESDGRNVTLRLKDFAKLKEVVTAKSIQVLILDPLVAMHDINENDNSGMGALVSEIGNLTYETQVGTMIAHHDKKGLSSRATGDVSMDDARGAGSIVSSCRMVLNVGEIKKTDAHKFDIDDADVWKYMAVSKGSKANYSPRDPNLKIFLQNSIIAKNATWEFKDTNTVSLSLHTYSVKTAISDDETNAVLDMLDKNGEPVGVAPQHERYLGKLIAETLGIAWGLKTTKADVQAIMKLWIKRKYIAVQRLPASGSGKNSRKALDVYVRGECRPDTKDVPFEAVEDEE